MNATVEVRRGLRADRDFVRDLGRRSATSSLSAVRKARYDDVLEAFERLADFVYGRRHELLIAERDGARAGFLLVLYDIPDEVTMAPQAFIAYMAVEPAARGRGVGRALLDAAEAHARAEGLPHMSLMVTDENAPARALYDGAGYQTERRLLSKPL
ncbi:MAG TPA: GNAT family N-acetyltransferase [Candidatus Elarobacter sp.]|nr:GNAT family N-acetyltransferase [Candidatus Elarobacter sp.]